MFRSELEKSKPVSREDYSAFIKRARNEEFFKVDNVSDFKSIRECYKVSKQLYECLKYFDSRSVRFAPLFSSYNQKIYAKKRSFVYPSEYYCFQSFGVRISIQLNRRTRLYFVSCEGWKPKTFKPESDSEIVSIYGSDSVLSVVVTNWHKILFEYLDGAYSLGL